MADTNETINSNASGVDTTAQSSPNKQPQPAAQQGSAAKTAQSTQPAPARSNVIQRPGVNTLPGDNSSHPLNVAEQERKDAAEAERKASIGEGLPAATVSEMEAGKKALDRNKPRS